MEKAAIKLEAGTGNAEILKNAGLDKLKVDEIVSIPKGRDLDPTTYLSTGIY